MNKKVIRKKREAGNFTQIPLSILKDKRISNAAFRTLAIILSESDNYKLYKIDLSKKLDTTEKSIQNHFKELEDLGYLRRENQSRGNFYIISEFGNLNQQNSKNDEKVEVNSTSIEVEDSKSKYVIQYSSYEKNQELLQNLLEENKEKFEDKVIFDCMKLLMNEHHKVIEGNCFYDIETLSKEISRIVKASLEDKKRVYNEYIKCAEPKFNRRHIMKKGFDEFKKKLRNEIFEKHDYAPNYDRLILQVLKANTIVARDAETERQDAMSQYD